MLHTHSIGDVAAAGGAVVVGLSFGVCESSVEPANSIQLIQLVDSILFTVIRMLHLNISLRMSHISRLIFSLLLLRLSVEPFGRVRMRVV